ncbi:hypothetical protein TeGR_g3036 [Tetraparma gracilis]|uniref:START domain-containing protein n=1 Tax=Tetraparma gracilis TaxID=2962635 RepID=A0ABQ6MU21_9STRA|nr:hypothetical protein TeGR_g3036 [Tetraparma gracilis]
MERSASCHVDALALAWALVSDLPGCFAGRRPAVPDAASLTFPPPPAEAAVQRSLRLSMQATRKRHAYSLTLTPATPPSSPPASSTPSYSISFHPSSPASIAVSGAFLLVPAARGTCALTMSARLAAGGGAAGPASRTGLGRPAPVPRSESRLRVSARDALLLLDDLLSLVAVLFSACQRCAEIDGLVLGGLATHFRTSATAPTAAEKALIDKHVALGDKNWARLKGTVREPVEYFQALADGKSAWGKASTNVDVAAEHVLAWLWHGNSYERLGAFVKSDGDSMSMTLEVPDSHSRFSVFGNKLPLIDDRVFATWNTWERARNDDFVVAFTLHTDFPDEYYKNKIDNAITNHKSAAKAVKGSLVGFWRISPLASNVCRVTFVGQGSMGGLVPDSAMKFATKKVLSTVDRVRDRYERSGTAVDAELRGEFPPPPLRADLGNTERLVVDKAWALQSEAEDVPWEVIKSDFPLTKMWIKHVPAARGERSIAWGKAGCTVDCSAITVLAWSMAFCSRDRMRINEEEGNPARLVIERNSPHSDSVATIKKVPFPFRPREFVVRQVACALNSGSLLLAVTSIGGTVVDYGMRSSAAAVRGTMRDLLVISPTATENQCDVTQFAYMDAGGRVPAWAMNKTLPISLSSAEEMRCSFERDDEVDRQSTSEIATVMR